MDNNESNLDRDDVKTIGDGIGLLGTILTAIAMLVSAVVDISKLSSGDKDDK